MVVNKIATNKLTLTQTKTSASSQNMVNRIQFTPTDKKPAVQLGANDVLKCFGVSSFKNKKIFVDRDNYNTVCRLAGICGPHADEALDISQHYDSERCDRAYNLLNWVLYSHGYHLVSIKNQRSAGKVIYALSVMLPLSQNGISASAIESGEYLLFTPMTSYERHLDRAMAEITSERQALEQYYQLLSQTNVDLRLRSTKCEDENKRLQSQSCQRDLQIRDLEIKLQAATDTIKQLREANASNDRIWNDDYQKMRKLKEDLEVQLEEFQKMKTLVSGFFTKQQ